MEAPKKSHPPHADGLAQELGILSHCSMIAAIVQGQDGWFRVPNGLVEAMHLMPKSTVVTLLVLMRYADDQGQAWPSIATIGRLGGISKRSTVRALAWLERSGLIRRIRRRGPAEGNQSTIYQIQLPWYEQAPLVPREHQPLCHGSTNPCATRAPTLVPREHQPLCHGSTNPCATGAPTLVPPEHQDKDLRDKDLSEKDSVYCSEPSKKASEPQPSEKAVMVFSCVGTGPSEWALTDRKLREYQEAYPGIDVLTECRRARQWLIDNPPRRKTAKGMPRFLNNWLSRAQDRAGRNAQPAAKPKKKDYLDDVLRSAVAR